MSQYWRENAFVFVPSSYINVKWQNRSNTPLLYIQYTPPPINVLCPGSFLY